MEVFLTKFLFFYAIFLIPYTLFPYTFYEMS